MCVCLFSSSKVVSYCHEQRGGEICYHTRKSLIVHWIGYIQISGNYIQTKLQLFLSKDDNLIQILVFGDFFFFFFFFGGAK